jgi:large subunit ribosomal protein L33
MWNLKKEEFIMAKNENRVYVTMKCTECGNQLRPTVKNKKNTTERLEIKKYCPKCRKTVTVKEAK